MYLFIISLVHSIWCLKNNTRLILFFSFQVSSVDIWPIKRTYSRTPNWGEYEIYFAFVKWRIKLFYLIDMTHEHQTRCLWTVQYVRHVNLNFIKKNLSIGFFTRFAFWNAYFHLHFVAITRHLSHSDHYFQLKTNQLPLMMHIVNGYKIVYPNIWFNWIYGCQLTFDMFVLEKVKKIASRKEVYCY